MDGILFDSAKEAQAYWGLSQLEKSGKIAELRRQVTFAITVNGIHVCNYIADFTYYDEKRDYVVADAKGMRTQVYTLKKRLLLAARGIEIKEL